MDRGMFWRGASNWGFLAGAALFGVNIIGWLLKLEVNHAWLYELLMLAVLLPLILVSGRRNAEAAPRDKGYAYGRAVGFVLATMLFAGVVYGVGKFLLVNFIAPDYYGEINARIVDAVTRVYSAIPQYAEMMEQGPSLEDMLRNPFYLIFQGMVDLVFRGGFLGLVVCAFVVKKPDIFAGND